LTRTIVSDKYLYINASLTLLWLWAVVISAPLCQPDVEGVVVEEVYGSLKNNKNGERSLCQAPNLVTRTLVSNKCHYVNASLTLVRLWAVKITASLCQPGVERVVVEEGLGGGGGGEGG
jgi:hypothetical protein